MLEFRPGSTGFIQGFIQGVAVIMNRRDFISGMAVMAAASRLGAQSFETDRVIQQSIPVFAHYCTWHSNSISKENCSTIPLRRQEDRVYGYDSKNPEIIRQHNAEMLENGIMPLLSWWDKTTFAGDAFLDAYFPVPGVAPKVGILYEATDQNRFVPLPNGEIDFNDERNAAQFISDMEHLQTKYFGPYSDRFFKADGRPVVFIWISHIFKGDFTKVVERAREKSGFYLIGSNYSVPLRNPSEVGAGLERVVGGMDAISSYGIYNWKFYGDHLVHSDNPKKDFLSDYSSAITNWSKWLNDRAPNTKIMLPMEFMYDDRHIPSRKADGDDAFWSTDAVARDFAELVRSHIADPCGSGRVLPFAYITSYNEHYEGTAIEPSEQYGSSYLDIIRQTFTPPIINKIGDQRDCGIGRDPRR